MNRRILFICCALFITILLCSCQLAREDGLEIFNDRLVGVYITQEYIDLFDFESYLSDNIHTIEKGGEITFADNEKYSNRKYAEFNCIAHINEETSEEMEAWEYVFEGLDGIPFFYVEIVQPDGLRYSSSSSDSKISDGHISIGNDTSLEGTIYITPNDTDVFYINPVYQSSDGQVYLTSGSGMSFSGDIVEGAAFTTTLEEKYTVSENSETTEESFKITIQLAVKHPPTKISIIQMNSKNTPVSQQEYHPLALPENMVISKDIEYIIVETRSTSQDGEILTREIFNPTDDYFTSYTSQDDEVLEATTINLQWK